MSDIPRERQPGQLPAELGEEKSFTEESAGWRGGASSRVLPPKRACMFAPAKPYKGQPGLCEGLAQSLPVAACERTTYLLLAGVSAAVSRTPAPTECVMQRGTCAGARVDLWGLDPAVRPRAPLVSSKFGSLQSL